MPRPPLSPEIIRLAEELIARLGKYAAPSALEGESAALARRGLVRGLEVPANPLAQLETPVVSGGVETGIKDAGEAMNRVLGRVMGLMPETFARKPRLSREDIPGWLETKPASVLREAPEGLMTRGDVTNKVGQLFLKEASRFPNKPLEQIKNAVEPSVYQWAQEAQATVPIPQNVAARQRMVRNAGKITGRDPNDPAVAKAREWLRKHGVEQRFEFKPLEAAEGVTAEAPLTHESLLARKAAEEVAQTKWDKLMAAFEKLTDKQKEVLGLRFELDRTGKTLIPTTQVSPQAGKGLIDRGPALRSQLEPTEPGMSQSAIARLLGIREKSVAERESGAIKRLQTELGVKPRPSEPPRPINVKELRLEDLPKPPLKETVRARVESRRAEFENSPASRLVLDPNGDVRIGDQTYRRVPIQRKYEKPTEKGKRGRRYIEEIRSAKETK